MEGKPADDAAKVEQLRREFEKMFDATKSVLIGDGPPGAPTVVGFAITRDAEGHRWVQRFGNASANGTADPKGGNGAWVPYTVLVIDKAKEVISVRADMPGVPKRGVELTVKEQELSLEAQGADRKYRMRIALPRGVMPDGGTARLNDGVLQIELPLAKPVPAEGVKLEVG